MSSRMLALILAAGLVAVNPGIAEHPGPGPVPGPFASHDVTPKVPALALVPEPAAVPDAARPAEPPPAANQRPAGPAGRNPERADALMRALYLLSIGGGNRPFPLLPQE